MTSMNSIFHLIASLALVYLVYLILKIKSQNALAQKIHASLFKDKSFYVGSLKKFLQQSSVKYNFDFGDALIGKKKDELAKIDLRPWRDLFYSFNIVSIHLSLVDQSTQIKVLYMPQQLDQKNSAKELEQGIVKSLSLEVVCQIDSK